MVIRPKRIKPGRPRPQKLPRSLSINQGADQTYRGGYGKKGRRFLTTTTTTTHTTTTTTTSTTTTGTTTTLIVPKDYYTPVGNQQGALRDIIANTKRGQTWETTSAYDINSVEFSLQKNNSPTGNIWVEIYSLDIAGLPDSLLGSSDNVDVSGIANDAFNYVPFDFSTPVSVEDATEYAAVLAGDFAIGANHVLVRQQFPGAHAGKGVLFNGYAWSGYPANDHLFKVFGS